MIFTWFVLIIGNSAEIHLDERVQVSFECGEIKKFELPSFEEEQKLWARVMWPGYYPAELVPSLRLVREMKHESKNSFFLQNRLLHLHLL